MAVTVAPLAEVGKITIEALETAQAARLAATAATEAAALTGTHVTGAVTPTHAPAGTEDREAEALITFRVGDTWLAVAAMCVEEICDQSPPMAVPRAPAYVPGVINLRGHAIPLLDLHEFLHLPAASQGATDTYRPSEETIPRVLLVGAAGMRVGLLCDQVGALEQVPKTQLRPVTAIHGQALATLTRAELVTPTLLAVLLDVPALLEAARVRK